ncbi:MAG: thioesterase family protein [Planctomycetota bacterium]|nr:thioesterase family protein [Planctomycetota bacterium]
MSYVHRLPVRVRYPESDPMGRLHHSVFLVYFEMGRTEYLRERGVAYADMERAGQYIAIVSADVKYRAAARYDEALLVETWVEGIRGARIFFKNRVVRPDGDGGDTVIAEATICGALIGPDGRPRRFPEEASTLMLGPPKG